MASHHSGGSAQHNSTMQLVGIVRCPIASLTPYGKGRQLDPKAVQRLARRFAGDRRKKGKCRPTEKRNHIRGITTFEDLDHILAALNISHRALLATTLGETSEYPLLSGHRIACLDGRHRLAAAAINPDSATAWWVVQLFCVHGTWVDFPLRIGLPASTTVDIRGEVEYYSHETRYSDGDLFTMIWESRLQKETDWEEECWDRLTDPKAVNLKGFLKNNGELARALYALSRFPGVIWGFQLGSVHKYPPYLIHDHILHHLQYILRAWNHITDEDPRVMACVCSTSVQNLQLRAPAASESDRRAIRQMFSEGTVFPKLTDLDLRRRVQERILSLDIIIPSVETFHENMKYLMIGARIIRRYLLNDEEPQKAGPGDVDARRRSLFERLSEDWTAPPVQYLEVDIGKFAPLTVPRTTAHLAYLHVLVAALRHFACLDDAHPRQDRRGEKMPAGPVRSWVIYLLELARRQGFDNQKIRDGLAGKGGKDGEEAFEPKKGVLADWRGGTPFTKTYLSLQQEAFLHKLAVPIPSMDKPTPAYIFKDTLNAFIDGFGLVVTQLDVDAFMQTMRMDTRVPPETPATNGDPSASSWPAEKIDEEMDDAGGEPPDAPPNIRHAAPGPIRTAKKSTRQGPIKRKDKPEHGRSKKLAETLLHKKTRHALGSTLGELGTSLDTWPTLPPSPPSNSARGIAAETGAPTTAVPISGGTSEHNHDGVPETIIHKATRHALDTSAVFPESLPLPPSPLSQNATSTNIQGSLPVVVDELLAAPVDEQTQSLHIPGAPGFSVDPEGVAETILHNTTRHALQSSDPVSFAPAPTTPRPLQLEQASRRRLQSNDNDPVPTRKPQAKIKKANRSDESKKSAEKLRKGKPHAPGDPEDLLDASSSSALQADADVVNSQIENAAHKPPLATVDQEPALDSVRLSSFVPMTDLERNINAALHEVSLPVIEDSVIDVPSKVSPPEQASTMSTAIGETSFVFDATQIDFRMTNGNDRQGRNEQKLKEKRERRKKPTINAAVTADISEQTPPTSKNTLPRRRGKRVPIPEPATEVGNALQLASDLPLPPAMPEIIQSSATADLYQATSGVSANISAMVNSSEKSQLPQTARDVLLNVGHAAVGDPHIGQVMAGVSTSVERPQPVGSILAEVQTPQRWDGPAGVEGGTINVSSMNEPAMTDLDQAGVGPGTNQVPQASATVPATPVVFGEAPQLQFAPSVSELSKLPPSPGPTETLPRRIRPRDPARSRSIRPIRKMKGQRTVTPKPTVENETTSHVADDSLDYIQKPTATDFQSNPKRAAVYINPKRAFKLGGPSKKVRDDDWRADDTIPVFQISQGVIEELRAQIADAPEARHEILAKKLQIILAPFNTKRYPGAARSMMGRLVTAFSDDLEGLLTLMSNGPAFWEYLDIPIHDALVGEPLAPENATTNEFDPWEEEVEEL